MLRVFLAPELPLEMVEILIENVSHFSFSLPLLNPAFLVSRVLFLGLLLRTFLHTNHLQAHFLEIQSVPKAKIQYKLNYSQEGLEMLSSLLCAG